MRNAIQGMMAHPSIEGTKQPNLTRCQIYSKRNFLCRCVLDLLSDVTARPATRWNLELSAERWNESSVWYRYIMQEFGHQSSWKADSCCASKEISTHVTPYPCTELVTCLTWTAAFIPHLSAIYSGITTKKSLRAKMQYHCQQGLD
jgi:hypothetical protein